ncbi:hypothetical protein GLOIN_2v1484247 [Rhizophagus clarus]|uniref:Uncharacterized protein n=1 Tax=Rhizophagus clarus TaxID=94130 RepID=A0A8H3LJQ3_9GLOM|nr:hypothetical protein GLOIN_2v1484247 [Rhizophagus clarus]
MDSRNMIKENYSLIFNQNHSNLFPDHLNGKRWRLFNSSSVVLRKVIRNKMTCDLIKQNMINKKDIYRSVYVNHFKLNLRDLTILFY